MADPQIRENKTFPVYDDTGCIGALLAPARFLDARSEKTIRLNSGEEISVPSSSLKVQPDGSFRLLQSTTPQVSPPHDVRATQESGVAPQPRTSSAGDNEKPSAPRIQPALRGAAPSLTANQIPVGSFFQDEYEIERVSIGRIIDTPLTERHEGETLVLPVVEEVLVYEKKLYLREEIRITRRKKPVDEVRRLEQEPGKPQP